MASQYECGDVLLASYPFTDQSAAKQRPVVVVSGTQFNQGEDIVVVPLSSRVDPADAFGFAIRETDPCFQEAGLRVASSVKWSKPMTISTIVIKRRLGFLPLAIMRQIAVKMQELLSPPTT